MFPGSAAGICSNLSFDVGDQFAARNFWKRNLNGFFVFDFIIFALCRNAPTAKAIDLAVALNETATIP